MGGNANAPHHIVAYRTPLLAGDVTNTAKRSVFLDIKDGGVNNCKIYNSE